MKLYIANGRYVGTQADAKKLDKDYEQVEVPTDKEGLIGYLNAVVTDVHHALGHEDQFETVVERHDPPITAETLEGPTERLAAPTLQFDDAWETFPLAKKLHFAALACEDAREAIKPKATPAMPIAKIDAIDDELFG